MFSYDTDANHALPRPHATIPTPAGLDRKMLGGKECWFKDREGEDCSVS
ncbi:MAG: hypothetical protein KIS96_07090 [Bauldia sp.]|nr:hypothetical protein [Bauldia sp.]